MSWVFNQEGDELINLDKVERLGVFEVDGGTAPGTHMLLAQYQADDETAAGSNVLFTGSREECDARLRKIASSVHTLKL